MNRVFTFKNKMNRYMDEKSYSFIAHHILVFITHINVVIICSDSISFFQA